MARSYWSISYWETGAGAWIQDRKIPAAGIDSFTRTSTATIQFIDLASGEKAKLSSETKSTLGEITLLFPKQVVTESFRVQMQSYLDEEKGIKIVVPIATGANSYTERLIRGYMTKLDEVSEPGNRQIRKDIQVIIQEFDVAGED